MLLFVVVGSGGISNSGSKNGEFDNGSSGWQILSRRRLE